jgi:hypothetical protein
MEDAVIKFNESRLPEQAREKLLMLDARRVEESAASSARLPYEVTDAKITERVRVSQDKHRARHDELHLLCSKIRQWLNMLPDAVLLESAPPVNAKVRDGLTLAETVEETRSQINTLKQHIRAVQTTPLPKADLKASAALLVQQLAQRSRPKVSAGRDGIAVAFTDPHADTIAHHHDIANMLAWLDPDALTRALEREIDAMPEQQQPMPKAEQENRVAELAANLLELERAEESLIDAALAEGVDIMRRADADPRAVLGIAVAAKQRAQAA